VQKKQRQFIYNNNCCELTKCERVLYIDSYCTTTTNYDNNNKNNNQIYKTPCAELQTD